MSRRQLCSQCSTTRLADNIRQMEARSGPNFKKWRQGLIRATGVRLVETSSGLSAEFDENLLT